MNRINHHMIALTLCWLLFTAPSDSMATVKRHLVLYGGFDDTVVDTIAENAEILVVGRIRRDQLEKLKKIKPGIVVLKYQHALSVPKDTPAWDIATRHPSWFATERQTQERLVQDRYGWYLMNIVSEQYRDFLVERIVAGTERLFDGVFLDDFWDHYVSKFVTEGARKPGDPRISMIRDWQPALTQLLMKLRQRYAKRIFINGAHECYISYVDGVMEESFVHANWHPETYFHPRASDLRSIQKIQRLSRHQKPILVQSGTSGRSADRTDSVFRYCLLSYLLVSNEHTYFNFHPSHTYHFRKMYFNPLFKLEMGVPKGPYSVYRDQSPNPNLIENGDFDAGAKGWHILTGTPTLDSSEALQGSSIRFTATADKRDMFASDYLAVDPGVEYTLSVYCKSKLNIAGSADYKRLGLQGRYYDREKKRIAGAYDLKLGPGTYDWQYYETVFESPPNAAYFQLRVGFIGDGMGTGWIDRIYFGRTLYSELVYRRDFSEATILVNAGNHKYTGSIDEIPGSEKNRLITINPRHGMLWQDGRWLIQ